MRSDKTHPFMTYEFDVTALRPPTWLALGEAMSKCQHLAGAPLKPHAAEKLASVYLRRGVQATTAIEGNTLSDEEVQKIVDHGTAGVSESRQYLEREVQNVLAAVRDIDQALTHGHSLPVTRDRLCELNKQVLDGIPDAPEVVPGELRKHDVTAGRYRAVHWPEVPEHVERLVRWVAELRDQVTSRSRPEERFVNAVLAAILTHLYIAWIHPFGNGNGRVARLFEVQILSESGVVPLVATNLLSDHYNKTRNDSYRHLDLAQTSVAEFVQYAVRGFLDELRDQIREVRDENHRIHWESYVYEVFNGTPNTDARARQRQVALAMPIGEDLTPEEATVLTLPLAKMYGAAGGRTPARDMNQLVLLGLVTRHGKRKYRARHELVKAFLPPVAK